MNRTRLHLDPLARDPVALERVGAAVAGERGELSHLHLERGLEGEAERSALVEQGRHRHLPAPADLAEQVLRGHLHAVEEDLVELGLTGDLRERANFDTGGLHVDDQVRKPRVAGGLGVAPREQDAEAREVRERRPHLLPVDDEVAVLLARARAYTREVGARARLGEALAPDLLRGEDRLEIARLLLLGPVRDDRRPGHAEADHADVRRRLCACHLLEEDRVVRVRRSAPAVLLRPGEPRVARIVQRAAPCAHRVAFEPSRSAAVALELLGKVLVDPGAELAPERSFLGGVPQIHLQRS